MSHSKERVKLIKVYFHNIIGISVSFSLNILLKDYENHIIKLSILRNYNKNKRNIEVHGRSYSDLFDCLSVKRYPHLDHLSTQNFLQSHL